MRIVNTALLASVVVLAGLASAIVPAAALGGCGPNGHRNGWGRCVWGGQNEDWCLRRTGHVATRMANGELVCFR